MAKVRVPKEHRPPERFKPFGAFVFNSWVGRATFKVKGVYRRPKSGEYFWSSWRHMALCCIDPVIGPRVILEEVKE